MNRGRRYRRWLKRALIIYVIYLGFAYIFLDVNPRDATLNIGSVLGELRQFLLTALVLMFFMIIQFVALFWFLARGTTYVVYPNEYDHTFDDVRGQPAAVKSTKEVLRLFMGFKNFKQMGGYPPHGILFEGPPGTGKTLMAKAIAGSANVPFLFASGSGFASMFMGIGNIKVRRMFKKARTMSDKYGGSVIFIDELDALGGSRGAVSQRFSPPPEENKPPRVFMGGMAGMGGMGIVNELLVGMDGFIMPRGIWRHVKRIFGFGKPKVPFYNILVIGATNRAATLDPALLRPGRFDRKIHVGLPDGEGREDIAQYYLAKVRHEPVDVSKLGRMTQGYSPAMIKNVINEALIFALDDGRDALRWDDLWQAKLVEEIGLKQPVKYTEREKVMVATHEAAHAVASYILQRGERQIQVITIQKRESALGLVHGQNVEESYLDTESQIEANIQVFLAGLVAEDIWFGQSTSGPSSDLQVATRLAAQYIGLYGMGKTLVSVGAAINPMDPEGNPVQAVLSDSSRLQEVNVLLAECRKKVAALLKKKRHVVEGLRDALLEREELIGDEIEEIMAELGEREPLVPVASGNGPVQGSGPGNGELAGDGRRGDGQQATRGKPAAKSPPKPPPRKPAPRQRGNGGGSSKQS
ncbi:MAG TPA: AAA family ATPase [Actinomycetota bacterium]|nr:AAA family ATPase [Actinomycetota bacterium]